MILFPKQKREDKIVCTGKISRYHFSSRSHCGFGRRTRRMRYNARRAGRYSSECSVRKSGGRQRPGSEKTALSRSCGITAHRRRIIGLPATNSRGLSPGPRDARLSESSPPATPLPTNRSPSVRPTSASWAPQATSKKRTKTRGGTRCLTTAVQSARSTVPSIYSWSAVPKGQEGNCKDGDKFSVASIRDKKICFTPCCYAKPTLRGIGSVRNLPKQVSHP